MILYVFILYSLDFPLQSKFFKSKNKKERILFKKITCESLPQNGLVIN